LSGVKNLGKKNLSEEKITGDETSMLHILKRQKRLSVPKATDLTGFETERARSALENLRERNFVELESNDYWLTQDGVSYLAFARGTRNS
jgi:hypothetical protein